MLRRLNRMKLGLLLLAAATFIIVNASVFVYYTSTVTLQATAPPVYLAPGNNTGQPDLWGNTNTITVVIGDGGASAAITVHPTYGKNYYKNLTLIVNQDPSNSYTVYLRVNDAFTDSKITSATLYVYNSAGSLVQSLDLKYTSAEVRFTLPANDWYRIDLEIVVDETGGSPTSPPSLSDTSATFEVIYTPSSETPP